MNVLDQPTTVRAGEEVDAAALQAWLRANVAEADEPPEIQQFPRGFSNLTYGVRVGTHAWVLRRPPFGANIRAGHDMGREYRILQALHGSAVRVPRPIAFCADESVLGAPFYLMERVQGVILRNRPPAGLLLDPPTMRRVCVGLLDTLVALHRVPYETVGLGDLGKPAGYTARQVAGWTQRYANARTDDLGDMDALAAWLSANTPATHEAALIHNDFRYDNVVLDPDDLGQIRAILDWEMATLGDPLTDLGVTLAYWAEADDPPSLQQFGLSWWPGNLRRAEVAAYYAEQSGRDIANILFYYVYGLFKNGVIAQQIYARYRQGLTHDSRFGGLLQVVRDNAALGIRALERGGIH